MVWGGKLVRQEIIKKRLLHWYLLAAKKLYRLAKKKKKVMSCYTVYRGNNENSTCYSKYLNVNVLNNSI